MAALLLADEHPLGVTAHVIENVVADQAVVDHHVGSLHRPQRLEGQQVGIARAGADDGDVALRRRCGGAAVDQVQHRLAGRGLVAGQNARRDGAVEHGLPQPPAVAGIGDLGLDRSPEGTGEAGQPAEPGGQAVFQVGTQPARQHRRGTAAGNADNDRAAIDNRRHDEGGKVGPVDHVDRHRRRPRRRCHRPVGRIVAGRADRQRRSSQIGRAERPGAPGDGIGFGEVH